LSQDVAELTREIAGSNPSRELYALARRVAEAQIDLRRVRHARYDLLSSAVKDPDYESPSKSRTKANCGRQLATKRERPQKFASILSDMARHGHGSLRTTRVVRKFAIRAFDAARRQAASARE
jgi:hypothetical protein